MQPTGKEPQAYALLMDVCGTNTGKLHELLDIFRDSTAADLARLHAALAVQDRAAVQSLAHRLASGCATFGEADAVDALRQLETAAADQAGAWAAIDDAAARVSLQVEAARARALAFMAGPGNQPPA